MKITSTTSTRFVTSHEPARKPQVSDGKPLADASPAPSKPMAAAAPQKFVSPPPSPISTTQSLQNSHAAANDNRAAPKAISAQVDARQVYETVAHFKLSS
jgi:hypothetical protein